MTFFYACREIVDEVKMLVRQVLRTTQQNHKSSSPWHAPFRSPRAFRFPQECRRMYHLLDEQNHYRAINVDNSSTNLCLFSSLRLRLWR